MEDVWYKLDNAAKIYPAVRKANWAPVFRIDAFLKDEVDTKALQSALIMTYKRFPTFSVHISKGLFWYYFEPKDNEPEAMPENTYPVGPFSEERDKGYLFRVLYYKKRVSLEVFHSISDGYGASVFLKTLLFNYLSIVKGNELSPNLFELEKYGILYYKDLPNPEETEDSFRHFALDNVGLDLKESAAFKIPGTRIKRNVIRIIHVLCSVNELHSLAKKFDATITEFLTALFIYSILNARVYCAADKRPIKISVPVNLRKRFPSKTLRNFSSYINVEVFPKRCAAGTGFEEICCEVKNQIRRGQDIESLRNKFSSNVNAEKNIALRVAPLFIKDLVFKYTFSLYGERLATSTISNIGNMVLPECMQDMVERFDFVNGAPRQSAMNCAVVSYKDTASISFTSTISENTILKEFVSFLVEHSVEVNVETNY